MKNFLFFAFFLLTTSACLEFSPRQNGESLPMNTNTVQTDLKEISNWFDLSNLPQPEKMQWIQRSKGIQNGQLPGPTDYYVVALLRYPQSLDDSVKMLFMERGDTYIEESLLEDWMPSKITESFIRTPEGYLKFNGVGYEPGEILLFPLSSGYILFIEEYIFIYGTTN